MKTKALLALAGPVLTSVTVHAASDTDVYLKEVESVTIGGDAITITGSALTRVTTISENPDPNYAGGTFVGKASDSTWISSQEATFTIRRPDEPGLENPFWPECVAAAKKLKGGEPTGRIAFYRPQVVIEKNRIVAITGRGYLMPKPGDNPARAKIDAGWKGGWLTNFANGVRQHNTFSAERNRASNTSGWAADGDVKMEGDRIVLTYRDDRVERWTRVGHRMVVEHWHPAKNFPAGKPVVGIAERVR